MTTGIASFPPMISRERILTFGRGLMNSLINSVFSLSRNTGIPLRTGFPIHQSGRSYRVSAASRNKVAGIPISLFWLPMVLMVENLAVKFSEILKEKSGVTRLTLTDFRNYANLRIKAEIAPIVIYGENGSGKTNVLEAISFLTPGRGLRGARLNDIKRFIPQVNYENSVSFVSPLSWAVAAEICNNGDVFNIATAVEKNLKVLDADDEYRSFERRIVRIDGNKASSQADLGRFFSAVWITPQMDRMFRGGSQPRRAFLDRLVYAFDMEHAKRTSVFEHLYREWYKLIKEGRKDPQWLLSLEEEMATTGVAIAAARREQVARLNAFIENEPDDVFPSEGDYSDASQRSKRDVSDINSEKFTTNRSERSPSEGSVTKRRRVMREYNRDEFL